MGSWSLLGVGLGLVVLEVGVERGVNLVGVGRQSGVGNLVHVDRVRIHIEGTGIGILVVELVHLKKHVHVLVWDVDKGVVRRDIALLSVEGHLVEEEIHVNVEVEVVEVVLEIPLLVHHHGLLVILPEPRLGIEGLGLLDGGCRVENSLVSFSLFVRVRYDLDRLVLFLIFLLFKVVGSARGDGDGVMLFEGFGEFIDVSVELAGVDAFFMGVAFDVLGEVGGTSR